jgi:hypothetical protein
MDEDGDGDGFKCLEDTNSASKELLKQASSYTPSFNGDDNIDELHDEVVEAHPRSFANKPSKKKGLETTKSPNYKVNDFIFLYKILLTTFGGCFL